MPSSSSTQAEDKGDAPSSTTNNSKNRLTTTSGGTTTTTKQCHGEEQEEETTTTTTTTKPTPTISVVGYSLRAPNSSSVPEFAQALRTGEDLTTSNTRYPSGHLGLPPRQGRIKDSDFASFDAEFFKLSHKQAEAMDPLIRMLLEVSYEAMLDAQVSIERTRGSKTGVYVGHCFSDDGSHKTSSFNPNKNGYELVNGTNSMAANRLSYFYDFKGPSLVIDTACSSSLVALHYAVRDLKEGTIDRAMVAGLSLTSNPHKNATFNAFTMLSPTGHCHVFDERADGYCRSDGVACVILERNSSTKDSKGYVTIAGTGVNSDGCKAEGITYPSAQNQSRLMEEVFRGVPSSWVKKQDIKYHEAHGTGTVVGDREELTALSRVYKHPMVIGSVKSNMGHAEGASGLMGLIKILLMIEDKCLYPNHGFEKSLHSSIQSGRFTVLKTLKKEWIPGACSISSFGFGGTNAFAIFLPSKSCKPIFESLQLPPILPFASSKYSPEPSVTRSSSSSFYARQKYLGNNRPFPYVWGGDQWKEASPLVFVFNGQGSQWEKMGKDLIQTSSPFRSTMERLEASTNIPLVNLFEDGSKWFSKEYSTIGIVSFQLAGLASEEEVLQYAMVRARLTGLIDPDMRLDLFENEPEDGFDYVMKVDIHVSDCEETTRQLFVKRKEKDSLKDPSVVKSFSMDGQMLVVGCSASDVDVIISKLGLQETRVACYNAPLGQTVSGAAFEIDMMVEYFQQYRKEMFLRKIDTDSVAYHAIYMKTFQGYLSNEFGKVRGNELLGVIIPPEWISTSRNGLFNSNYLVQNILRPVYFQEAIEFLPKGSTVVEIGPSPILFSQIKRIRSDLTLFSLVERKDPSILDLSLLQYLRRNWPEVAYESNSISNDIIPYKDRYPRLWSSNTKFHVMSWDEFELPDRDGKVPIITYDLTRMPWDSLRDHIIRGQNLFPAVGYLHALWSGTSFKRNTEMLNFKIHTPLVISPTAKAVKMSLHKAGPNYELWDDFGKVRYASAHVQISESSPLVNYSSPFKEVGNCHQSLLMMVNGDHFYPNIRRLGYEYGAKYQLVTCLGETEAHLKTTQSLNWISYMDAMIHLRLFNEDSFGFPIGFDRVFFQEMMLSDAPLWAYRPQKDTIVNNAVLLEGLRMEYLPVRTHAYPIHKEVFVEYNESDKAIQLHVLASLICRESESFSIKGPLVSIELNRLAKLLRESGIITQDENATASVILSDSSSDIEESSLLLTVEDPRQPDEAPSYCCLVARWGNIRAYRWCNWSSFPIPSLPIVSDWKNAARMTGPFIWKCDGASGAVASLVAETKGRISAHSYEGAGCHEIKGLEKGMRHNFIREDGSHGIFVSCVEGMDTQNNNSSSSAYLRVSQPGQLSSLVWDELDPSDYSIEVSVASLNFRDVMRALGQLKEKDLSVGLEFSGYHKETKQRVFGVAKNSIGSHCSPVYCFQTPSHLSDVQAATIPVVYLTAYYALFHKAHLKKGQSILIHAGTGGVGMAAIRLAQSYGLNIFATCSAAKREYLKETFGLEDHQIGDSRSEAFVQTILQGTNKRGVDAALNQLSGALQVATLRCMAPGGHFCEIGKYDIMQNTALAQGLLAANISFHAIDLLPLLNDVTYRPLWNDWLSNGFARGEIVPLPTEEFHCSDVESAFRFMSQAKHIGKIVITGLNNEKFVVSKRKVILGKKVHLITGGLGGLGLSIALRLASNGCKNVNLVGRAGVTTGFQRSQIAVMKKMGCQVNVIQSDLQKLEKESLPQEPDTIWHAATVYRDVMLSEMTEDLWNTVFDTKVKGYLHLRRIWPSCRVVSFSSVAAYHGNALQTSYALANATLDAYARISSSRLLSIRLGPLDNVGFVTQGSNNRLLFERVPFKVMNIDGVVDCIMRIVAEHESGVFGIYDFKEHQTGPSQELLAGNNNVLGSNYTLTDAQAFISVVLGGRPDHYSPNTSLKSAGLDSLSTMEVVNYIHKESGKSDFKPSDIDEAFTIHSIVDYIVTARGLSSLALQPKFQDEAIENKVNEEQCDFPATIMHDDTPLTSIQDLDNDINISPADTIQMEEDNPTRVITLKISPSSIDFREILTALKSTDILIIRQLDPTVFNHGAPIESDDNIAVAKFMDNYVALAHAFEFTNSTVIVAVEGQVRGGGMLFPAVADVCLATVNASFGLPEIHRNMVPSVVSKALVERLGRSTTRRLSLTGESFQVEQALRIGLVDHILKAEELDKYIADIVRRWESSVPATQFIKNKLLPRAPSHSTAMGTMAGTWLTQQNKIAVGEHQVLKLSIDISGVAILTMCDTTYQNTMTFEMTSAIRSVIPQLKRDAKVIILTSSLKHFHVGLNPAKVREWRNRPTCHVAADMKESYMGYVELATLGLPLIAVLNGKVYGGGIPIALWCDYRIASDDVDMHYGNLSRGMSPAGQLSELLKNYLSPSGIMEAYLENSHWDSNDLLQMKIVSSVAPSKEKALSQARKLASFIARNPEQGMRDTLHLLKVKYAAEVADEESWLIAQKITGSSELFCQNNAPFSFDPGMKKSPEIQIAVASQQRNSKSSRQNIGYGIIAFEAYTPSFAIDADTLEKHSIRAKRKQGQEAVAVWDAQEDSISMAMNAVANLLEKHITDPYSIGRIEVGTESNVDMAKSIKSYLMDLFPSDHVNVEGVDNTNACYGGTAALLNTISWCRETGGYGIVVATDTADMDLGDSAWRGASAVAMLVGINPWLEIHPERTSCFKNTHDFLKPRFMTQSSPLMKTKESMNYYIEALDTCIRSMNTNFSIDTSRFDAFVFHGGLCATFMKLVERHLMQVNDSPHHWDVNFNHARSFATQMGGLYTASLFVNLMSLLHGTSSYDHNPIAHALNEIGIFAYGSGSTATLMRATIHQGRSHTIDLATVIRQRKLLSFDTLSRIVKSHETDDGAKILERHQGIYYRDLSQAHTSSSRRIYHRQSINELPSSLPTMEREFTFDRSNLWFDTTTILKTNKRVQASVALLVGWIWWLAASIFLNDYKTVTLFIYTPVVFLFTTMINVSIKFYFQRGNGWSYMLGHYSVGIFTFISYLILLIISRSLQIQAWRPIYFGWYTYDSLQFVILWEHLSPSFRAFLSIHHSLSLLCTGTWFAVGGHWSNRMIVAVTIWLTSDIWHYSLSLYRLISELGIWRRLSAHEALRLENMAFWMERMHRISAYAFIFIIEERTSLLWLIFGTGLLFDVIDSYFRIASIRTRKAELRTILEQEERSMLEVPRFGSQGQQSSQNSRRDESRFPLSFPLINLSNNSETV